MQKKNFMIFFKPLYNAQGGAPMPDTIIKIIPRNPFDQIPESLLQKGADFLNGAMRCDSIRIQCSNSPVFVDCGSNLERIVCPECGSKLSFDWWGEIMTRAAKSGFSALEIILPCCGKKNSLNDLKYYFPCGFACCQIDLLNPTDNLEAALIDSIEKILHCHIRVIKARI